MDKASAEEIECDLSKWEDLLLAQIQFAKERGADPRWLAIAITNLQLGFMAAKRALYDGKRVTDDLPKTASPYPPRVTPSPGLEWGKLGEPQPTPGFKTPPVNKAP